MPAFQIIDLEINDKSKSFAPASKISAAIFETIQSKGRCTPKDLFIKGFSPAEVTQHWHFAHSIASLQIRHLTHADA